jgi:hypothetical protein
LSLYVFEEEQDGHVVLVLAGVQAAAQIVAEGSNTAVEFGFLESHSVTRVGSVRRLNFPYGLGSGWSVSFSILMSMGIS